MNFTYTRNDKEYTLPFNPELLGFSYFHCKCSFVKFVKKSETSEIQLAFYPLKEKIQVEYISKKGNTSRHEKTDTINEYPINQRHLEEIIAQHIA